ncbi:hypothetical protein C2E23DRAFT_824789 [Lenzites betulinus]|nr:hypothetical protein C2E23DRAFT_824789 [Lenzites betulinus]
MQPLSQTSSPISRLSDDILYEISGILQSQICFPGGSDDVPYDCPAPLDNTGDARTGKLSSWAAPIVLSHVCSRWRAFALASPRLWSLIRITGTFQNRMLLNTFVERSQNLLLSILFTKSTTAPSSESISQSLIFDFLAVATEVADLSERIRELGVVLPYRGASVVLEALSHSPIPRLQKLWLDEGLDVTTTPSPFIRMLNINPMSVRVLHARRIPLMWMPFEGLVRLELSSGPAPSLEALLFTLKSSPLLEVLQLRVPTFEENSDVPPLGILPISLFRLRELLLSVEKHARGAFTVLAYISFPATTEVGLYFTGYAPSCLYEHNISLQHIAAATLHARVYVQPNRGVTIEVDDPYLTIEYDGVVHTEELLHTHLYEGLVAVPLPALEHLELSIVKWASQGPLPLAQGQFDGLFDAVANIVQLSVEVHPEIADCVAAALAPCSAGGNLRCTKLQRWSIVWRGKEPSVDEFWRIERCCAARAAAGAPLEYLETSIAVPSMVLDNLQRSVTNVVVINDL